MGFRRALCLAVVLVCCSWAAASASRIRLTGGEGYSVWLRGREIPVIPRFTPDSGEVSGEADALARLAAYNDVWTHVRDTQFMATWFVGVLEPSGDGKMVWPGDQIIRLRLWNGVTLDCAEVLASRGPALPETPWSPRAPMVWLYPGGASFNADDLRVRYPDGGEGCVLYVRFPRLGLTGDDVLSGELVRGGEVSP